MMSPSVHIAAVTVLLFATQQGAESHRHHHRGGRAGRHRMNAWPAVFSSDVDTGAFRPFSTYPRGGGIFTPGAPLLDVFQEVFGDIKKAARELSDGGYAAGSTRTPAHEVLDLPDSVTLIVDLPGCKKQDIDAQISQDSGTKTLTITATRKKLIQPPPAGAEETAPTDAADVAAGAAESLTEAPPTPSMAEEKFELSFRIGDGVDVSGIRGTIEDGVLTLVLPRVAPEPPAQPIEIPINPPAGKAASDESGGPSGGKGKGSSAKSGAAAPEATADTHISLS